MSNYEIIIYWSQDDAAYIAEVPELPGCISHGPTKAEAVVHAEEAIASWIETAKSL